MTCKWLTMCPLRRLEQQGVIGLTWRRRYCESDTDWKRCERYKMEEQGIPHADDMMPDGSFVDPNVA
ncbi:MAG: uracil-DNA glycosylase [Thermodesulfobacteriota bacterium]|nr:uracil-DNA glycosylase [Thermodesulfobacteriota bacterium]